MTVCLVYNQVQFLDGPGRGSEIVDVRDGDGSSLCTEEFARRPRAPPEHRIGTPRDQLVSEFFFAAHKDVQWQKSEVLHANQTCHPTLPQLFRAGWNGVKACGCDGSLGALNCDANVASRATWQSKPA